MPVDASRTYHANQAVQLSELLLIKFSNQRFGTTTRRVMRVTEPDGPSTDGGLKARQTIVLAPEDDESGANLICGFVDSSRRTAELRSFIVVSQQYQARYNEDVDISRGEYDRFLQDLMEFLKMQGIDTRLTNTGPGRATSRASVPAQPPPQVKPPGLVLAVSIGLIVGFALGFVIFGLDII